MSSWRPVPTRTLSSPSPSVRHGSTSSDSGGSHSSTLQWRTSDETISGDNRKSAAINDTITHLQDEQERVQKKTFTKWFNAHLKKHVPPSVVRDLFEDIRDGLNLIYLLEVLSGVSLPKERGPKLQRVHYLSNIATALKYLEKRQIKLVNINPADVVDGKPSIVLGLVWTIILYFQIEENTKLLEKLQSQSASGHNVEDSQHHQQLPVDSRMVKQAMLNWTQQTIGTTTRRCGIDVKDFGKSWRDGVAFNAMIYNLNPELVDLTVLAHNPARVNLENAFSTAETHLGIPRLLDPEDVDVDKPDEKSIMTYVSQFMEKYSETETINLATISQMTTAQLERLDYDGLVRWTREAKQLLSLALNNTITDQTKEYQAYQSFVDEYNSRSALIAEFQQKVSRGEISSVGVEDLSRLQEAWLSVTNQSKAWHRLLDSNLPGRLGAIASWLIDVEQLFDPCQEEYGETGPRETVQNIRQLRAQMLLLEQNRRELQLIAKSSKYHGETLSPLQVENLTKRMDLLASKSEKVMRKLDFEEAKHQLRSLADELEAKLVEWNPEKHGSQAEVARLCDDYQEFVNRSGLPIELDHSLQRVKVAFEKLIDSDDIGDAANNDVRRLTDTVNVLKMKFQVVSDALNDADDAWKNYRSSYVETTRLLSQSEREQQDSDDKYTGFFACVEHLEIAVEQLQSRSGHLVPRLTDGASVEVRRETASLELRCREVSTRRHQLREHLTNTVKQTYHVQLVSIHAKLSKVRDLLSKDIECRLDAVYHHRDQLEKCVNNRKALEDEIRVTHSTIQSLGEHLDPTAQRKLMEELDSVRHTFGELSHDVEDRRILIETVARDLEDFYQQTTKVEEYIVDQERLLAEKPDTQWTATRAADRLAQLKMSSARTSRHIQLLESAVVLPAKVHEHLDRLSTQIAEADVASLKSRIESNSHQTAVQITQLEFVTALAEFSDLTSSAEKNLRKLQQKLQRSPDDIRDFLDANADMPSRGELSHQRDDALRVMYQCLQRLRSLDEEAHCSVERVLVDARARNEQLDSDAKQLKENLQCNLVKHQEFSERLRRFEDYTKELEELREKLNESGLQPDEYRRAFNRYKELAASTEFFENESKWLQTTRNALWGPNNNNDADGRRLNIICQQFSDVVKSTSGSSSVGDVACRAFEFLESASRQMSWLDAVSSSLPEVDPGIDDVDSLKTRLASYEALLGELNDQRSNIEETIRVGQDLGASEAANIPQFINNNVAKLYSDWSSVQSVVRQRCNTLRSSMQECEKVEKTKAEIKAAIDSELSLEYEVRRGSHVAVTKQTEHLRRRLYHLELVSGNLARLKLSSDKLPVADRRGHLELDAMDATVGDLLKQTKESLRQSEQLEQQWNDVEQQLNHIGKSLSSSEVEVQHSMNDDRKTATERMSLARAVQEDIARIEAQLCEVELTISGLDAGSSSGSASSVNVSQLRQHLSNLKGLTQDNINQLETARLQFDQLLKYEQWASEKIAQLAAIEHVYRDKLSEVIADLKIVTSDCSKQSDGIQRLEQEVTRMAEKCASPLERRELADKFSTVKQLVSKVLRTANNLTTVLTSWFACHESLKLAENKLRLLEGDRSEHVRTKEPSPNEAAETSTALRHLQQDLTALETRCESQARQLASCRVAVTDATSKCRINLRAECGTLRLAVDDALASRRARLERQDRLTTSWTAFEVRRSDLVSALEEMEARLGRTVVHESTLTGVEELDRELEAVKVEIAVLGEKYDEVRSLGRSLIASASLEDDDEADRARQSLTLVAEQWERVQRTATDMRSTATSVVLRWNLLKEAEQEVSTTLECWSRILDRGLVVGSDSEARQLLETYSHADVELQRRKKQYSTMTSRLTQLANEAARLPGFQVELVNCRLDPWKDRWNIVDRGIQEGKDALQKLIWKLDRLQYSIVSLERQLNDETSRIQHHLDTADQTGEKGHAAIDKYKTNVGKMAQTYESISLSIQSTTDLNAGHALPELMQQKSALERHLNQLQEHIASLDKISLEFAAERDLLDRELKTVGNSVSKSLEAANALNNVFGEDDDVSTKLVAAQAICASLRNARNQIEEINSKKDRLERSYLGSDFKSLERDLDSVRRSTERAQEEVSQICDNLRNSMEHRVEESIHRHSNWLTTATKRSDWCKRQPSNLSDIEEKLSSVAELTNAMERGTELGSASLRKLERFEDVLGQEVSERLRELSAENGQKQQELNGNLEDTRRRLLQSREQWESFTQLQQQLLQWTSETEFTISDYDCVVSSSDSHEKDLQRLTEILNELESSKKKLVDELCLRSTTLSRLVSDPRIINHAQQLRRRLDAIASAANGLATNIRANVDLYAQYIKLHDYVNDWLTTYRQDLEDCQKQTLNERRDSLQNLQSRKDEGSKLMTLLRQSCEKLHPSVSSEVRGALQLTLSGLLQLWESCLDEIDERTLSAKKECKKSADFDRKYKEIRSWLQSFSMKLNAHDQVLLDTMLEKKQAVRLHRAVVQEIQAYRAVITDAVDFSQVVGDAASKAKILQLEDEFACLSDRAKRQLKNYEDQLSSHSDFTRSCADLDAWLDSYYDQLTSLSTSSPLVDELRQRIQQVQVLAAARQARSIDIAAIVELAEKAAKLSGPAGTKEILDEQSKAQFRLCESAWRTEKTLEGLTTTATTLQSFDMALEDLEAWLTRTGSEVEGHRPRTCVSEQKKMVDSLTAIHELTMKKQPEIADLELKASSLPVSDAHRLSSSEQLTIRFQNLLLQLTETTAVGRTHLEACIQYEAAYESADSFVRRLVAELGQCSCGNGSLTSVKASCEKLRVLSDESTHAQELVRGATEKADELEQSLHGDSGNGIRQHIAELTERWRNFSHLLLDSRQRAEQQLVQMSAFEDSFHSFVDWLATTSDAFQTFQLQTTLKAKKLQLLNLKILHQDIVSRRSVLVYMTDNVIPTSLPRDSGTSVPDVTRQYSDLLTAVSDRLIRLEKSVGDHEHYRDLTKSIRLDLDQLGFSIASLPDSFDDVPSLRKSLAAAEELIGQIASLRHRFNVSNDRYSEVMRETAAAGQEALTIERQTIEEQCDRTNETVERKKSFLDDSLRGWTNFETKLLEFVQWTQQADQRLQRVLQANSKLEERKQLTSSIQQLVEEIETRRHDMEDLEGASRNLREISRQNVRLQQCSTDASDQYKTLLSTAKEYYHKLARSTQNWSEYRQQYEQCTRHLADMKRTFDTNCSRSGNKSSTERQLMVIKDLQPELKRCETAVDQVFGCAQRLFGDEIVHDDRQNIETETAALREDLELLTDRVSRLVVDLETRLSQWTQFGRTTSGLLHWIEENPTSPDVDNAAPEANGSPTISERLAKLEWFRMQGDELLRREQQVGQLEELISKLTTADETTAESNGMQTQMAEVRTALAAKRAHIQVTIGTLEAVCAQHQQYLDAAAECEKWLLEVSFSLASHSAVCACELEDAHSCYDQHLKLNDEIERFQSNLDHVTSLGHCLVSANQRHSHIEREVELKLSSLTATYSSLKAAASHVKEKLAEAVDEWDQYASLVRQCESYLNECAPAADENTVRQGTVSADSMAPRQASVEDVYIKLREFCDLLSAAGKATDGLSWNNGPHNPPRSDSDSTSSSKESDSRAVRFKQEAEAVKTRLADVMRSMRTRIDCNTNDEWHTSDRSRVAEVDRWLTTTSSVRAGETDDLNQSHLQVTSRLLFTSGSPTGIYVTSESVAGVSLARTLKTVSDSSRLPVRSTSAVHKHDGRSGSSGHCRTSSAAGVTHRSPAEERLEHRSSDWSGDDGHRPHVKQVDCESGYAETVRTLSVEPADPCCVDDRSTTSSGDDRVLRAVLEADSALRQHQTAMDGTATMQHPSSTTRTIIVEHPVKVVVVGSGGEKPTSSSNTTSYSTSAATLNDDHGMTSLPLSMIGVESDMSSPVGGSMTRVNVIFDDDDNEDGENFDDDDDDVNRNNEDADEYELLTHSLSRGQVLSESGEVLWSPDGDDNVERSNVGKYEIEVIEHRATRTSTVLVPNTALDSSSSSSSSSLLDPNQIAAIAADDSSEDADETINRGTAVIGKKIHSVGGASHQPWSTVASAAATGRSTPTARSVASSTATRELGTQTIQDGSTQTDTEQWTQTSPDRVAGRPTNYDWRPNDEVGSTNVGSLYQQAVDYQPFGMHEATMSRPIGNRGPSFGQTKCASFDGRLDNGDVIASTMTNGGFVHPGYGLDGLFDQRDFSQQTPAHSTTQTPVKVRLGVGSVPDLRERLMDPFGAGRFEPTSTFGPVQSLDYGSLMRASDDHRGDSRNFGTQTFGQPSACLTADSQTQTTVEVSDRDSVSGTSEHSATTRHRRNTNSLSHGSASKRPSSSTNKRTAKNQSKASREDGDVESEVRSRRSHRSGRNDEGNSQVGRSSLSGTDSSRKDLIRLMLHEIRDLKTRAASSIAGDSDVDQRPSKNSTDVHSSHHRHHHHHHHHHHRGQLQRREEKRHRESHGGKRRSKVEQYNNGNGDHLATTTAGVGEVDPRRTSVIRHRPKRRHSVESYIDDRRNSSIPLFTGNSATLGGRTSFRNNRRSSSDAFPFGRRRAITPPPNTSGRFGSMEYGSGPLQQLDSSRTPLDDGRTGLQKSHRHPTHFLQPTQQQQQLPQQGNDGGYGDATVLAPTFNDFRRPVATTSTPIIFIPEMQSMTTPATVVPDSIATGPPTTFLLVAGPPQVNAAAGSAVATGTATTAVTAEHRVTKTNPDADRLSAAEHHHRRRRHNDDQRHYHHQHGHRHPREQSPSREHGVDDRTRPPRAHGRNNRKSTAFGGVSADVLSLAAAEREVEKMRRLTSSIRKHSPQAVGS